jgi:hypothetical protein
MNKKALLFLVVLASFLLIGCELIIIYEVLTTRIYVKNSSSETIVSCFIYNTEEDIWEGYPVWERSCQTIPVGETYIMKVTRLNDIRFRFESAIMFWECLYTAEEADWDEKIDWTLIDLTSQPL